MELTDVFITVTTVYKIQLPFTGDDSTKRKAEEIYETTDSEDMEGFIEDKTVEYVVENP